MALTDTRDAPLDSGQPRESTSLRRLAGVLVLVAFLVYLTIDNLDAVEFRVLGASYGISRGILVVGAFVAGVGAGWAFRSTTRN